MVSIIKKICWKIYIGHLIDKVNQHAERHEKEMETNENGEHYICGLHKVIGVLKEIADLEFKMA